MLLSVDLFAGKVINDRSMFIFFLLNEMHLSSSGAGGMSLGLEKYFNVKWVVDNDHMAAATLRANKANSDMQIYTEDVKTFLKRSYQGNKCYPVSGEVDHVHASPPCKGFSRANRNGGKNDMINNKVCKNVLSLYYYSHY